MASRKPSRPEPSPTEVHGRLVSELERVLTIWGQLPGKERDELVLRIVGGMLSDGWYVLDLGEDGEVVLPDTLIDELKDAEEFAERVGLKGSTIRKYGALHMLPPQDGRVGGKRGWRVSTIDGWVAERPHAIPREIDRWSNSR